LIRDNQHGKIEQRVVCGHGSTLNGPSSASKKHQGNGVKTIALRGKHGGIQGKGEGKWEEKEKGKAKPKPQGKKHSQM